jgi:hypothetical protein
MDAYFLVLMAAAFLAAMQVPARNLSVSLPDRSALPPAAFFATSTLPLLDY